MKHIIEQLDILFVIKVFAVSFSVVALYVLIANAIVYLLMQKSMDDAIRTLMKRFLFIVPFRATGYWFAAGLLGYIAIVLRNAFFSRHANHNTLALREQPRMVLVIFTLVGICYGTLVGLAAFFKAKKALSSGLK